MNNQNLLSAASSGNIEAVRRMIAAGVDVNVTDIYGMTPLLMASAQGHTNIVYTLLEAGAGVNFADKNNTMPLHHAVKFGYIDIVLALIAYGAHVNIVNEANMTPLHIACAFGHTDIVRALISAGADINTANNRGETSLFMATERGRIDIVSALIEAGADVNIPDNQGRTPLTIADLRRRTRIAQLLFFAGARTGARDHVPVHVDPFHVHNQSKKYKDKLELIASILKEDLGKENTYPSFAEHFDDTIGKIIKESPLFNSKSRPNNKKPRNRNEWIKDYDTVKDLLSNIHTCFSNKTMQLLNYVIDIVLKYKLEECYIPIYISDTAHAYEGNSGHTEESCIPGAVERIYTTFFNCIKGMDKGIFGKINRILELENATSWDELSKESKGKYIEEWNNFVNEWATEKKNNELVRKMTPEQRSENVMSAFKSKYKSSGVELPVFVEDHIRNEFFEGLIGLWQDYGFNSEKSTSGGKRSGKRYYTKKAKKTKIYRKKRTVKRSRKY
jgi:ankyrin repeat protein